MSDTPNTPTRGNELEPTPSFLSALGGKVKHRLELRDWKRERQAALNNGAPRLGVLGAHGLKNLGDEALFEAARQLLTPNQLVTYRWKSVEDKFTSHNLSGASFFSAGVLGGGTLINDYSLSFCRQFLDWGLPQWTMGTGAGSSGFLQPRSTPLDEWRDLLPRFSKLGVRGPLSLQKLQAIGVANGQVVGDLALYFARPKLEAPAAKPRVLFNLMFGRLGGPKNEFAPLAECEKLAAQFVKMDFELVSIAMNPEDVEPMRAALERGGIQSPVVHCPATTDEFFALAATCSFGVCVRLHAAVLAACAGVPCLMIGYRDKCLDFMLSMGLEAFHLDMETVKAGQITSEALALWPQSHGLRAQIHANANGFRQKLLDYASDLPIPTALSNAKVSAR